MDTWFWAGHISTIKTDLTNKGPLKIKKTNFDLRLLLLGLVSGLSCPPHSKASPVQFAMTDMSFPPLPPGYAAQAPC